MGNVSAAQPGGTSPPLSSPTATTVTPTPASSIPEESEEPQIPAHKPGPFDEIHSKTKEVFPMPWDGARVMMSKGINRHFQVSHTIRMNQNAGYSFGAVYQGAKTVGPGESYPILVSEIDPSGTLNARILHSLLDNKVRCEAQIQFQNGKVNQQFVTSYKGKGFSTALTMANANIATTSGVFIGNYFQRITEKLDIGAELMVQSDNARYHTQYSIGSRYTGGNWVASGKFIPQALTLNLCYYHKLLDNLQAGVELMGSAAQGECEATVGYSYDLPNVNFKGQIDTNYTIGATMEKKLLPLPFSFCLSAVANHTKSIFRFGLGLSTQ